METSTKTQKININIKKLDASIPGTVQWLLDGLKSGDHEIYEDIKRGVHHGLWLRVSIGTPYETTQELAIFHMSHIQMPALHNEGQLTAEERADAPNSYSVGKLNADNKFVCTEPCWGLLMNIAVEWGDQCQDLIDYEHVPEVHVLRVGGNHNDEDDQEYEGTVPIETRDDSSWVVNH